jgi:acetate kinase
VASVVVHNCHEGAMAFVSVILVLNVGSSSLKCATFDAENGSGPLRRCVDVTPGPATRGRLERALGSLQVRDERIVAIGHRLVHGGADYSSATLLTHAVRADLDRLISLAPEHLPSELAFVDAALEMFPTVPQVLCFDTAFHSGLPNRARHFPLPRHFADEGVVRYGFHGLSYESVLDTLRATDEVPRRLVIAHLGGGASLAAILEGRSIDTTMGLTPTGGVLMGTRTGDLDPGVLLYLMRARGLSVDDLERAVNERGGLLGLSGTTSDMRELLARESDDPHAAEAVDMFCYQIAKAVGSYAAALGGLDALVFTGGIGEHAATIRARVCGSLAWLDLQIDAGANAGHARYISAASSPVKVHIIPANEERCVAHAARRVLARTSTASDGHDA